MANRPRDIVMMYTRRMLVFVSVAVSIWLLISPPSFALPDKSIVSLPPFDVITYKAITWRGLVVVLWIVVIWKKNNLTRYLIALSTALVDILHGCLSVLESCSRQTARIALLLVWTIPALVIAASTGIYAGFQLWESYRDAQGLRTAVKRYCVTGSIHGPEFTALKAIAECDTARMYPLLSAEMLLTHRALLSLMTWQPSPLGGAEVARHSLTDIYTGVVGTAPDTSCRPADPEELLDHAYYLAFRARIWMFLASNEPSSAAARCASAAYDTIARILPFVRSLDDRRQLGSVTYNGLGTYEAMWFREAIVSGEEHIPIHRLVNAMKHYERAVRPAPEGDSGIYAAERGRNNLSDLNSLLFYAYVIRRREVAVDSLPAPLLLAWRGFDHPRLVKEWLEGQLKSLAVDGQRIRHPVIFLTAAQLRATASTYFARRDESYSESLLRQGMLDLGSALSIGVVAPDIGSSLHKYLIEVYFTRTTTRAAASTLCDRYKMSMPDRYK